MSTVAFFLRSPKFGEAWSLQADAALSGTDATTVFLIRLLRDSGRFDTLLLGRQAPAEGGAHVPGVESLAVAFQEAQKAGAGHLIFNTASEAELRELGGLSRGTTQLVFWAHNSASYDWLCTAKGLPQDFRIVAVSDCQRYGLVGHPVYRQSISIPNPAPSAETWRAPGFLAPQPSRQVVYIGALKPSKGFHHLARVWPRFHERHPDVRLAVCGSARLYDPAAVHGQAGVSDASYEEEILHLLGGSLDSAKRYGVEFLGSLPKGELREEMMRSIFAVVNPNLRGSTETFCCSAVEALSVGIPVVAARAGALVETVGHKKGGLLFRNDEEFLAMMDSLVSDDSLRDRLAKAGFAHVTSSYAREKIADRWLDFLSGRPLKPFCNPIDNWMTWRDHAKKLERLLPMRAGRALRRAKHSLRH